MVLEIFSNLKVSVDQRNGMEANISQRTHPSSAACMGQLEGHESCPTNEGRMDEASSPGICFSGLWSLKYTMDSARDVGSEMSLQQK